MVGGDAKAILVPQVYGGMKTPEYLALNPQGLIPSLVFTNGGALWESDVGVFIILSNMCDRPEFCDGSVFSAHAASLAVWALLACWCDTGNMHAVLNGDPIEQRHDLMLVAPLPLFLGDSFNSLAGDHHLTHVWLRSRRPHSHP